MKTLFPKPCLGFTLIELAIVVLILGLLSTIALPGYQNFLKQSRRTDAKAALLNLQLAQEKFRSNCVQYATGIHANTYACEADGPYNLVGPEDSSNGYYHLSISQAGPTGYTLTATHTGLQQQDSQCKTLSISQAGVKSSTNSHDLPTTDCW
ncbi:MAG: type IV pilin protein [Methylococcaceae bacterium]|jgi:type IV pilus assembly protein PilE